ncbi:hypothetical protein BGT96224_4650 [Blumeria graminis f. sp. tritici 96224]|uniref:Hap4 transcription factor heteromerisation domain-containing protein n=1 Tax=Blumeria graminis f. sp. tritici 96224 TaxID=1268274 RepID=A0A656KM57_BLUGR|nr:hypothetical protein BGT96224_4650 [Blumeria graminis f. sp. tritici 96224]
MVASAHPTLAIKQSNQHLSPMSPAAEFSTMGLVTRKEWVIPPRPKPGRKPATDTPPTKRKAQNRAAQRAFRDLGRDVDFGAALTAAFFDGFDAVG